MSLTLRTKKTNMLFIFPPCWRTCFSHSAFRQFEDVWITLNKTQLQLFWEKQRVNVLWKDFHFDKKTEIFRIVVTTKRALRKQNNIFLSCFNAWKSKNLNGVEMISARVCPCMVSLSIQTGIPHFKCRMSWSVETGVFRMFFRVCFAADRFDLSLEISYKIKRYHHTDIAVFCFLIKSLISYLKQTFTAVNVSVDITVV